MNARAVSGFPAKPEGSHFASGAISVIIALLAAGVELGENFQPSRVALACAAILAIASGSLGRIGRTTRAFLVLGWAWLLWGVISLFWTNDVAAGTRDNLRVLLGVFTVYAFVLLGQKATAPLCAVRRGWLAAVLLTIPVAIYEIITDQHLLHSSGHVESGGSSSFGITYAGVTFGNRNYYVAFLTLAYPYLLWSVSRASNWVTKFLCIALCAGVGLIVLIDASRLGGIVIGMQLVAWLLFTRGRRDAIRRLVLVGGVLCCGYWALTLSPYTVMRFQWFVSGQDESISARLGLLMAGMQMIYDTAGIGVGAGGFVQAVQRFPETQGLVDPHNLWIEVFSQYGVFIGTAFVAWLVICAKRLVRFIKRNHSKAGKEALDGAHYALLILVSLPLNGLMNSAYLSFTFLWIAIGCVALTVNLTEVAITRERAARRPHVAAALPLTTKP